MIALADSGLFSWPNLSWAQTRCWGSALAQTECGEMQNVRDGPECHSAESGKAVGTADVADRRCGAPTDDSPRHQPWVPRPHGSSAPAGRQTRQWPMNLEAAVGLTTNSTNSTNAPCWNGGSDPGPALRGHSPRTFAAIRIPVPACSCDPSIRGFNGLVPDEVRPPSGKTGFAREVAKARDPIGFLDGPFLG
jgi:hypothetical protein